MYVDTAPADTLANAIYPNTNWGTPTSYEPDWSWTGSQTVTVYLAPQPGSVFDATQTVVTEVSPTGGTLTRTYVIKLGKDSEDRLLVYRRKP